jgi:hypothetical protein
LGRRPGDRDRPERRPNLVTSRQEIGEFFRRLDAGEDTIGMRITTGWRNEALGAVLVDLFNGKRKFTATWADDALKVT